MSNKLLHFSNAFLLHVGILLSLEGDVSLLKVKSLAAAVTNGVIKSPDAAVQLADHNVSFAGWNLALGIGMILLAIVIHASLTLRDERPVRVRVAKKNPMTKRQREDWFWVNLHI